MTIQVFSPSLGQEELAQIASSFESGWIGKGEKVKQFEAAWAQHIGVSPENVVSVNCATEGLFQIIQLLDLWSFDESVPNEVIIPSIHFIGAANAISSVEDLKPTFCDVDKYTLNPTLDNIRAEYRIRRTKAVCLLHYGGVAQELDTIREWCDSRGLWLIEDTACSPATVFKGKQAGTWGHFGVWSFDAMKILSTGDGGMIYCENPDHAKELRKRLYLGMNAQSGLSNPNDKWWEFEVSYPGRRSIMNDLEAGIGLEQLKKLPQFIDRRKEIWNIYWESLSELSWKILNLPSYDYHTNNQSFYFYWIQTPKRDELAKYLKSQGVYVSFRYYPLHRVFKTGQNLPGADYAADNTLLLPLHCNLTDSEVGYICDKVKEFFS